MAGVIQDGGRVTRVAADVLCVDHDRVLLERWRSPIGSAWTLPGGGLHLGEDPAAAVRREVLDSTALVVEAFEAFEVLGMDSSRSPVVALNRRATATDMHALRIVYADRYDWVLLEALPLRRPAVLVDAALAWSAMAAFARL